MTPQVTEFKDTRKAVYFVGKTLGGGEPIRCDPRGSGIHAASLGGASRPRRAATTH